MADKVNKDYKTEVGRLYSTGIDYDNAMAQFLSKASENSIYPTNLVSQFDDCLLYTSDAADE